ncbi:hypothetical protein POM88_013980 [Heracleum sosnowskyi]|uniref:F-box domain-containing protein n=1 Tax=Heracleum sosnowskyi TaxID=360622 RepID=A0AAD8N384_9APIA|nr:hypothetical protein POM88_013980 [Heracleum sosnowskyi]
MEVVDRPAFGGMEKAFSNNIIARIADYLAGRLEEDIVWKAPPTAKKGRKRKKTCRRLGNGVWGAWDNLPNELLGSVLAKLSLIDYLSFSGVCKSWRFASIDFRKSYMEHQQPLVVVRPIFSKKSCVLYNMFNEKSYRTMLPELPCKYLLGLSCGYLITVDRKSGFWLVNLMTKHELRFPVLPKCIGRISYLHICALLFRSTRLSKTFLVLFSTERNFLLLSESGASGWQKYLLSNTSARISDVKIFDGKIFVLTRDALFGEFNPRADPVFKLYNIGVPFQISSNMSLKLMVSDEKLYTIICHRDPNIIFYRCLSFFEIDHKKMESVKQIPDLSAKSLFISPVNSAMVDTIGWGTGNCVCALHSEDYNKCSFYHLNGNLLGRAPILWDGHSKPYFWYFPSESWDISSVGYEFGI